MAYTDNKLNKIRVNQNEINKGIYKVWLNDKDIGICTLHVNKYANQEIDLHKISINLQNYIKGVDNDGNNSSDKIYGVGIYKVLEKYLQVKIDKKNKVSIDLRLFRVVWEHKKIMKLRIKKLCDIYNMDRMLFVEAEEIEKMVSILFLMIIKYSITIDKNILQRVLYSLYEIESKEKKCIEIIIEKLSII